MSILHAPILEQAGFSLGSSSVVKNYVYRLNGINQYIQFSDSVEFKVGDTLELGFVGGAVSGSYRSFVSSTDSSLRVSSGGDPQVFDIASTSDAKVNGVTIINNQTLIPTSGMNYLEFKSFSDYLIRGVGARVDFAGSASLYINLPIYNFKVIRGGTVIHEIPLTNKAQGATQLPTIGSVSATIVGYNENDWEEV